MIKLLPVLLLQVKYEVVDTLEDILYIAKKKEASLELTPIIPPKDTADILHTPLRASSSTSTLHSSNTPSKMETAMEELVWQITQFRVHLLQLWKFCNTKRDSNKVQHYACKKMWHISKDYLNHDAMEGLLLRWVTFMNHKGKDCVNMVEIQDEAREKAIVNFK